MSFMFNGCYEITSLDLGIFNTSLVNDFSYMLDCNKLTYIDFSNLKVGKGELHTTMIHECNSLKYLNLWNLNPLEDFDTDYIFMFLPQGMEVCINNPKRNNNLMNQTNNRHLTIKCY